jgi:hypothetical protein
MRRMLLFSLGMFLAAVGYTNASEPQKMLFAAATPDPAIALQAADRPAPSRMTPLPAQRVKSRATTDRPWHYASRSKHYYGGSLRECPGYTLSRRARLRVNRTVERLLARGYDDPLSWPVYRRAAQAERATYPAVDKCNMAWLRHVSIYTHRHRY